MQPLLIALLVMVLLTAFAASVVAYLRRRRRRLMLARQANQMALRFWVTDPFNIPRRYADMAVISGGHSQLVHNVTYGQINGMTVRAMDLNIEVGHGTSRTTLRWGVALVELAQPLPAAMLVRGCPGILPGALKPLGAWQGAGAAAQLQALVDAAAPLQNEEDCCIELRGNTLMAAVPRLFCAKGYSQLICWIVQTAENVALTHSGC